MELTEPIAVGLLGGSWGANFLCQIDEASGDSMLPFSVIKSFFFSAGSIFVCIRSSVPMPARWCPRHTVQYPILSLCWQVRWCCLSCLLPIQYGVSRMAT